MRLGFVYFENSNNSFKKELVRYNTLLKNYFDNDDNTVVKKLNETFGKLLKNSTYHEILNEKESKIYNVIIDFIANDVDENDLASINSFNYNDNLKDRILSKMSKELPNASTETIQNVVEKSEKLMNTNNPQNIELVFIPSVIGGLKG
jgi:hypothetical protein